MISSVTVKKTVDIASTLLVAVAATLLIWTQIETRWLRPAPRPRQEAVTGLTIPAATVRHARGTGAVALVEFTDYECPFCGQHARNTGPDIDKQLVATGVVRHVVFNYPLERIHHQARKAGEAAECAGRQGRYWEMHDRLFRNQRALDPAGLEASSAAIGLDHTAFTKCLSGEASSQISADLAEGQRLGVNVTPTFFVGTVQPDGSVALSRRVNGAASFDDLKVAVETVGGGKRASR